MLDTLGIFLPENINMMKPNKEHFALAKQHWDLENLYIDLASAKGKNLTPIEKIHLCGLLCGYSPAEIAEKLHKSVNGIEVDFSNTIYQYVKHLLNRSDEKIENWRNICQWLEEVGYKNQQTEQSQANNQIPVDAQVHSSSINIGNQQIEIEFGMVVQLVVPLPSDSSKRNPTK